VTSQATRKTAAFSNIYCNIPTTCLTFQNSYMTDHHSSINKIFKSTTKFTVEPFRGTVQNLAIRVGETDSRPRAGIEHRTPQGNDLGFPYSNNQGEDARERNLKY
jgi:hypothetical protein